MSDIECPQCKKILKDSARRLVQDSCGHKKCRLCLLADEIGCPQCSTDKCIGNNNSDSSINDIKLIKDLKIEKHQTTVITCNKFCVKNKTSNVGNSLKTNKKEVEENAQTQNEIRNKDVLIQTQSNKRKYDLFTLPSHITVIKNNGDQYKCNVCQKTFYTKYYVNNHKYCAEGTKPFSCDRCKKSFVTKSQLEAHVLVHLDVAPYPCNSCSKSFKEKSKLKRHKLTHTKSTSFMCQTCGKGFKSKDYLKIHSYIHEEEKPFKCKICNIKFSNSSNLKKHLLKHSKEKNHMCDQCGKRFKSRWSLTVHRRSHARLRVHKCSECSKAFINAKELRRHLLTHIDLKPYSCGSCE
ncbi:zinc finger protein 525-like, partial [Agrilus planipennis]|uniref:Zinc finger protein 525-like n=1 Tax=Agrilus planipennis TaxID=224129 RepID=A0A7F5R200_AGRPL